MNPQTRRESYSLPVESVRINTKIKGEPAAWLKEWKRRGLVKSNTDAVIQAFILYNEKQQKTDLEKAQLERLRT